MIFQGIPSGIPGDNRHSFEHLHAHEQKHADPKYVPNTAGDPRRTVVMPSGHKVSLDRPKTDI